MSTKKKTKNKMKPSERLAKLSDTSQEVLTFSENETASVASPAESTSELPSSNEAGDFAKAISESQAAIAQADAPKNKGGRPKGSKNKPKDLSGLSGPAAPSAAPVSIIPSAFLEPAISFPFEVAALRTGFQGFKLEQEYAKELAPQVDAVLKQYLPQLESKHAALLGLATNLSLVVAMKYMAYTQWRAVKNPNVPEPAPLAQPENIRTDTAGFPLATV